ncbi:sensor histidine kinase [Acinetobacter sp. ANC 4648]|uniref:sensor histidine kinase n=1 Tax=Acinetobacter sp. ANC 4648 TaxID=1977875 RepID=UPI000A33A8B9|nr:HAMP domain-containing sensor histidine kinase [Acinetobacter sp. ANC 4648]OTG84725.1 two-component sensor histidine kinase [Acinetobacter sp. ANC 4648]
MRLELLEIGQADQLSACKLSLLLGVFTPDNRIEGFLKCARGILQAKYAILAFHHEPYIWYSSDDGFKAFRANKEANLTPYFIGETVLNRHHENYSAFSQHIQDIGIDHERIVAFDLKINAGQSIGQVLLFDNLDEFYSDQNLDLVHEFAMNIMDVVELRLEYDELKELYEQQSALNVSKTKFFQIIAHDLRAPFHGLIGFSEVLAEERETLDESEIQNIAEYLHDTTQSTYNLLENLLNWAIAEGGRFVYHPIHFKLKQVTQIVYGVLNTLAVKKNIELIEDISDEIGVFADINMMTSVIQNLVSNALKFTHIDGSGKVSIRARSLVKGVEVIIQDSGLGMTKTQIDTIFEPHIQVSFKGTSGEKGTGLGLVLCKKFIDLNHGKITVHSKEGEGTTFKVLLPTAAKHNSVLQVPDYLHQ